VATEEVEVITTLVDKLSALTVLQLSQLKQKLEEKWDVKAAAGAVMMAAPAAGGDTPAEASTDFEVTLVSFPADKKISVIKVLREITGLGLREAKEFAESVPKVLKESASKVEADEIKGKLAGAGAEVSLKGL